MTSNRRTVGLGTLVTLLISSVVLCGSGTLFYAWSNEQVTVAEQHYAYAQAQLTAKRDVDKAAAARRSEVLGAWKIENRKKATLANERAEREKEATALGYTVITDGFYFKAFEGDFCAEGTTQCAIFTVMTGNACPAGVAVTVEMAKDGVGLGSVYGTTEGLPAGGVAKLNVGMQLEVTQYQVTEATCMA